MPSLRPSSRLSSNRLRAVGWSPRAAATRPNIAERQDRPPAWAGGLQRGGALDVQRLGTGDVTFLEQHLGHQREIHCLAHAVPQAVIDSAGLLEERASAGEVAAETHHIP